LWRHHSTLTTETISELNFREPPHEFGSQLLEAGGELHEMQATLGHPTIGMTGRYLNATQKGVKGAFKKLESKQRSSGPIFEYACHEPNYGLEGNCAAHARRRELRPAHLLRWLLVSAPL
jgi:hypothetical protein